MMASLFKDKLISVIGESVVGMGRSAFCLVHPVFDLGESFCVDGKEYVIYDMTYVKLSTIMTNVYFLEDGYYSKDFISTFKLLNNIKDKKVDRNMRVFYYRFARSNLGAGEIEVPFTEWSIERIVSGKKRATTRVKKLGDVGDYFYVNGVKYRITRVEIRTIYDVAVNSYREEGCESVGEFVEIWRKLHPRIGFDKRDLRVYYHEFEKCEG